MTLIGKKKIWKEQDRDGNTCYVSEDQAYMVKPNELSQWYLFKHDGQMLAHHYARDVLMHLYNYELV